MILHRPNLASFKKVIIATTDRSFKLKQLHFDVTSIVLQSSDHTLKRAINVSRILRVGSLQAGH